MAIGFGPGADMQNSQRSNNNLRAPKKSLKELHKDYSENAKEEKPTYNEMSPEEYKIWKANLDEQTRRENRAKRLLFIGLVAAGIFFFLFLIFYKF